MTSEYTNFTELVPSTHSRRLAAVADEDDDDDDGAYEILSDDESDTCSSNSLNRESAFARTDREEFKRNQSTGGSRDINDRFVTAEIQNMKTRLRPTVTTNSFQNRQNTKDNDASVVRAPKSNHRLRQNENDVIKTQITDSHDVGNGLESVRIKQIKNGLRKVQPRISEDNEHQNCNFHSDSMDGTNNNEMSSRVMTPAVSKINSPSHRIGNREPTGPHLPTTPIKASHVTKMSLAARSASGDSGVSNTPSPRSDERKITPFKLKPLPIQQPMTAAKAPASRFASATTRTSDADDDDDGGGGHHWRQRGRLEKTVSEDRMGDNRINKGLKTGQDGNSILASQKWYFGDIGREISERLLNRMLNDNGNFLVRNSKQGGKDSPYALTVVYNRSIYHLKIRKRLDGKFSLGNPKPDEKVFNEVVEMITFHQNNPIELFGDPNKKIASGKVTLKKSPPQNC